MELREVIYILWELAWEDKSKNIPSNISYLIF